MRDNFARRAGKKVFVGLESSGKSLLMVRDLKWNIDRNHVWQKLTNTKRPIYTNMAVSSILRQYAEEKEVEILTWHNLWDLTTMTECDLYIDELATYFDSRSFADLPLDVRLWLAQAEKMGVEIVGGAQDYFQIDLSFRRLVKEIIEVRKILGSPRPKKTAPPVKRIWGIMFTWSIDPLTATKAGNQEEMKTKGLFTIPSVKLIRKKDTRFFDTNTRVALSEPPPLKKIVRICPEDGHRQVRYV